MDQTPNIELELDLATNLRGQLSGRARASILEFVRQPSQKGWETIHSIIIDRRSLLTVWQAVIAIDPTFPVVGPRTDSRDGSAPGAWPRIPTSQEIKKALVWATH